MHLLFLKLRGGDPFYLGRLYRATNPPSAGSCDLAKCGGGKGGAALLRARWIVGKEPVSGDLRAGRILFAVRRRQAAQMAVFPYSLEAAVESSEHPRGGIFPHCNLYMSMHPFG